LRGSKSKTHRIGFAKRKGIRKGRKIKLNSEGRLCEAIESNASLAIGAGQRYPSSEIEALNQAHAEEIDMLNQFQAEEIKALKQTPSEEVEVVVDKYWTELAKKGAEEIETLPRQ
jgi:hypothetical protein